MYKNSVKLLAIILTVLMIITAFCACENKKDVIILFTSDTESAIDENIGFAGLYEIKKQVKKESDYLVLADLGDTIAGQNISIASNGKSIIELMNLIGYNFFVPGDADFSFGVQNLKELNQISDAAFLGANIEYKGFRENLLSDIKPYEIKKFGYMKIGFVGIVSPKAQDTAKKYLLENDDLVYDFSLEDEKKSYSKIQKNIDKCIEEGADYVVALSHLGDSENVEYTSADLIRNLYGLSAVLDADSESLENSKHIKDKKGNNIPVFSVPPKFASVGKVNISPKGEFSFSLIEKAEKKSSKVERKIKKITKEYEEFLKQKIAVNEAENGAILPEKDLIFSKETGLGNFIADAFHEYTNADMAFISAREITGGFKNEKVLVSDVVNSLNEKTTLCTIKAKGSEIRNYLENAFKLIPQKNEDFVQLSYGFKCYIEGGKIKELRVYDGYQYNLINDNEEYVLACNLSAIQNGNEIYFSNKPVLYEQGILKVVLDYLEQKEDKITRRYVMGEGRIKILEN